MHIANMQQCMYIHGQTDAIQTVSLENNWRARTTWDDAYM